MCHGGEDTLGEGARDPFPSATEGSGEGSKFVKTVGVFRARESTDRCGTPDKNVNKKASTTAGCAVKIGRLYNRDGTERRT